MSGPADKAPAGASDGPVRRHAYILVVDDDADFREALAVALSAKGYAVETAADGREGLGKAVARPPLLVLLDLRMPVMNGRQMLQALRGEAATREVPVLIISAFGYEWEAELMGAQGYVQKPFDPAVLEATIQRLLRPRLVVNNG